jgi:hypothetical protein
MDVLETGSYGTDITEVAWGSVVGCCELSGSTKVQNFLTSSETVSVSKKGSCYMELV